MSRRIVVKVNAAERARAELTAPGWRGAVLALFGLGYDAGSILDCFWHGFLYFLPIYVVFLTRDLPGPIKVVMALITLLWAYSAVRIFGRIHQLQLI